MSPVRIWSPLTASSGCVAARVTRTGLGRGHLHTACSGGLPAPGTASLLSSGRGAAAEPPGRGAVLPRGRHPAGEVVEGHRIVQRPDSPTRLPPGLRGGIPAQRRRRVPPAIVSASRMHWGLTHPPDGESHRCRRGEYQSITARKSPWWGKNFVPISPATGFTRCTTHQVKARQKGLARVDNRAVKPSSRPSDRGLERAASGASESCAWPSCFFCCHFFL